MSSEERRAPRVEVTAAGAAAEVVKAAQAEIQIQDSKGRAILLKRPGVLAQYRLVEAVGKEAAENGTYMAMVMPLMFVASIDGDAVVPPVSKRQVEALIVRLDDPGLDAVMKGVIEHFAPADDSGLKDSIKN